MRFKKSSSTFWVLLALLIIAFFSLLLIIKLTRDTIGNSFEEGTECFSSLNSVSWYNSQPSYIKNEVYKELIEKNCIVYEDEFTEKNLKESIDYCLALRDKFEGILKIEETTFSNCAVLKIEKEENFNLEEFLKKKNYKKYMEYMISNQLTENKDVTLEKNKLLFVTLIIQESKHSKIQDFKYNKPFSEVIKNDIVIQDSNFEIFLVLSYDGTGFSGEEIVLK